MATKVTEIELSKPLKGLKRLDYQMSHVRALVRLHEEPLCWIRLENSQLPLSAVELGELIVKDHAWSLYEQTLRHLFQHSGIVPNQKLIDEAFKQPPPLKRKDYPLATAVIWLPGNYDDTWLEACLQAIFKQDHPNYEVLVACNGAPSAAVAKVAKNYRVKLISGANAFYRAAQEAQGEFISFTGTMAMPDKGWLRGVADHSVDNPAIAMVVGPHFPYELETDAQAEFEWRARHPYWFQRYDNYGQVYEVPPENFGTPLNVSFRREFLLEHCNNNFFTLDFGLKQLLTLGYLALRLGLMVGYEPRALVWERYPRDKDTVDRQVEQEHRIRAEFLIEAMRLNPGDRKILWEKYRQNPVAKKTLKRLILRKMIGRFSKVYAGNSQGN